MFETKKDNNENEMRSLLYGSIAVNEQALSSKIFLWEPSRVHCYIDNMNQQFDCLISTQ